MATDSPKRDLKIAALGGGHGLPIVLRALKPYTHHLTAIVTMADDGGSSGRLRREMGVPPPGDLRNNIAALADDEALMTQLFQYRFGVGALEGHAFGNLLLAALAGITGSMAKAVVEAGRVLAINGRVLPSTLQDVSLVAEVREGSTLRRIEGESNITAAKARVEQVYLKPESARAYPETIQAILGADLIVFGPGSLFTSILPSLIVQGIGQAIRASRAVCMYVCNIATQPGETEGFSVADHVRVIEGHVGLDLMDLVIYNNVFPPVDPALSKTRYVPFEENDAIRLARYRLAGADLTDSQSPWRHDPQKLASTILANVEGGE